MHYRQNRYQEFSHDTKLVHEQQTNQKAKELNLSLCYTNIKKIVRQTCVSSTKDSSIGETRFKVRIKYEVKEYKGTDFPDLLMFFDLIIGF